MNRPNILFLMTDQLRADHVGYSGESPVPTPNIDRIAGGSWFSNCRTVDPICTRARCALLTGKYAHQVGMTAMSGDLSLQHPTYPRALQRAGYHTAGVGKFHFLQTWRRGALRPSYAGHRCRKPASSTATRTTLRRAKGGRKL